MTNKLDNSKNCIGFYNGLPSVELKISVEKQLKADGYFGLALSKEHYNGDESCLTAYHNINVVGFNVLVKQCSDFFAYRITSKSN